MKLFHTQKTHTKKNKNKKAKHLSIKTEHVNKKQQQTNIFSKMFMQDIKHNNSCLLLYTFIFGIMNNWYNYNIAFSVWEVLTYIIFLYSVGPF